MSNQKTGFLPMWKKIAYGSGNAGGGFIWGMVTTFLLIYCTNVIGVSAAIIGTLLMIAKVFDGITDIFMGRIIDRTNSKMGKSRFWYLISCAPLGICMFLLFNVPGRMGEGAKYAWIFIFYLLISAGFYTMNQVAYNVMLARVTRNQHDQVTMSGAAMLGGTVGSVAVASATSGLVESFGGGQEGWTMVALIYAIVGVAILLIPFFVLKELPEEEFQTAVSTSDAGKQVIEEKISFGQTIIELLKNKYFILILLLYFVGFINSGMMQSSMAYYAAYSLENPDMTGMLGMCSTIPLVIGIPFMPKLIDKMGMRKANVCGTFISLLGCLIAVLGQFLGGITIIIAGLLIKAAGTVPGSTTYTPFMVKADEYHYQKMGHRVTGSLFSCATVGTKVGQGLGTAICGWVLTWGGFDGTAAVQSVAATNAINFLYLGFPVIFTIITAFLYSQMKVEDEIKQ